ncbi:hypothetical protein C8Q76DRAFT_617442 [Earliella scabrosa]|nr:hypothetical protein C8Q76DRAFT_617442 [Earliella scabrosa]
MPLSSIIPERVRAFAIKAVAKLKPRLTIRRRQAAQNNTSNNIRIRVPLGTVATVLKTTGQIGSSVPGLQMAMEGTAKIVERIEAARNTRKGCKELEAFVQSTIDELYAAKEKMNDEDLDDETWYRLAVLESRLNDIIGVVRAVQNQSRFKRLLNKDRNDAALAREREMLQKGVTVFQVSSCTSHLRTED